MGSDANQLLSNPDTKAGYLQRMVLKLLTEHADDGAIPTSIRFLFYELVDRGVIPKAYVGPDGRERRRTPAQDVSDASMVLRETGLIPWEWLVDETRAVNDWTYADSVYQYVENRLESARMDLWHGEPPPLVLCESRSLAGVLKPITSKYLTPIASTNGQSGGFIHTTLGPMVRGGRTVLYLGDHDLSGGHIERNTRETLAEYGELEWHKVAITQDQVEERDLPVKLKKDNRFKPARGFEAVETEALGQRTIVTLLEEQLEAAVPQPLEGVFEEEKNSVYRYAPR